MSKAWSAETHAELRYGFGWVF
eukprot:SAG11_NODE_19499_length_465_cov_1.245902_2_plen_21_part_01